MATKKEIKQALEVIKQTNNNKVILMKCTSNYPAKSSEANLKTILDMRKIFKCEVGLSDHTMGLGTSIASVIFGASIIEKHFTVKKNDGAVDSKFSMEPEELRQLVNETRNAWLSRGVIKYGFASREEEKNKIFRRSIYINKNLKKNHKLENKDIIILRPKIGVEQKDLKKILGKRLKKGLKNSHL